MAEYPPNPWAWAPEEWRVGTEPAEELYTDHLAPPAPEPLPEEPLGPQGDLPVPVGAPMPAPVPVESAPLPEEQVPPAPLPEESYQPEPVLPENELMSPELAEPAYSVPDLAQPGQKGAYDQTSTEELQIALYDEAHEKEQAVAAKKRSLAAEALLKKTQQLQLANNARAAKMARLEELREQQAELSKVEIDPGRWWATRSTGQTIAAYITAALGGVMASKQGRPWAEVTGFIDQAVAADIEVQKANLSNRYQSLSNQRGLLKDAIALTGDMERGAELMYASAMDQVALQVEEYAAQFSPGTTHAMNATLLKRQFAAKAEAARQASADKDEAKKMQQVKFDAELAEMRADASHTRAKTRVELGEFNLRRQAAMAGPTEADKLDLEAKRLKNEGLRLANLITKAESEGKVGEVERLKEAKAKVDLALSQEELDEKTKARIVRSPTTSEPLVLKSGKPWTPTKEQTEEANVGLASVQQLAGMVDQLKILREKHGGESDAFKSAAWQQMQSLQALQMYKTIKALGLGAPSDSDIKGVQKVMGGVEVTSFAHDPTPGFEAFLESSTSELNTKMRTGGYDQKWSPERKKIAPKEKYLPTEITRGSIDQLPPELSSDERNNALFERGAKVARAIKRGKIGYDDAHMVVFTLNARLEGGEITPDEFKMRALPYLPVVAKKVKGDVKGNSELREKAHFILNDRGKVSDDEALDFMRKALLDAKD